MDILFPNTTTFAESNCKKCHLVT